KALARDRVMTLRGRRDVNDIGLRLIQQASQILVPALDRKSLEELLRHQRLPIASGDDLAPFHALNLRRVRVGDLAASDDGDFKHDSLSSGSSRSRSAAPEPSARWASTPAASWLSRCCSASSSRRRATTRGCTRAATAPATSPNTFPRDCTGRSSGPWAGKST